MKLNDCNSNDESWQSSNNESDYEPSDTDTKMINNASNSTNEVLDGQYTTPSGMEFHYKYLGRTIAVKLSKLSMDNFNFSKSVVASVKTVVPEIEHYNNKPYHSTYKKKQYNEIQFKITKQKNNRVFKSINIPMQFYWDKVNNGRKQINIIKNELFITINSFQMKFSEATNQLTFEIGVKKKFGQSGWITKETREQHEQQIKQMKEFYNKFQTEHEEKMANKKSKQAAKANKRELAKLKKKNKKA